MTVVRAPGLMPSGRIGVRGWRAHCPWCGYLGEPKGYRGAEVELTKHRKTPKHKEAKP
jgi:hypothetical protein